MFSLVQRGQLYADDNGWPVTVYDSSVCRVVCRREDGRLCSVSIREFSHRFERLEQQLMATAPDMLKNVSGIDVTQLVRGLTEKQVGSPAKPENAEDKDKKEV
ncbi:DUF4222 domain-containing protein [Salmonella enterica]|nr:DUF4222 domain-containing protein [Salmonella enterica]